MEREGGLSNEQDTALRRENSDCPINVLNLVDDCLHLICRNLSVLDRLNLKEVCKRWKVIVDGSWSDVKTLYCDSGEGWGVKEPYDLGVLSAHNLGKILFHCSKNIQHLYLTGYRERDVYILDTILPYCSNVDYIYARFFNMTPESIRILTDKCKNIVELTLGPCSGNNCDEELSLLFRKNDRLRSLVLYRNSRITGQCLASLNQNSVEKMVIDGCSNVSIQNLIFLPNLNRLKTLELRQIFLSNVIIETAEAISECFVNLQSFSLTGCQGFPFSTIQIGKLSNVEFLDVSENSSMTDDLLVAINNNCRLLKGIDTSACPMITNRGLAAILALPNFEELKMKNLNGVTDEVFNFAPKLILFSFFEEMVEEILLKTPP